MADANVDEFVRRAEEVYATRLRAVLEPEHADEFVAIEPESGDYFGSLNALPEPCGIWYHIHTARNIRLLKERCCVQERSESCCGEWPAATPQTLRRGVVAADEGIR